MVSVFLLTVLLAPAQPATWPMDELTLVNGAKLTGLLLDETRTGTRFRVVRRPVGRPTVTMTCLFPSVEVKSLIKLNDADRKTLRAKLDELDATTTGERKRAEELTLTESAWPGVEKTARRYESESFTLLSSTNEEITRRTAIRLEQIFVAYSRYFPARIAEPKPTTIYLTVDHDDYLQVYATVLKLRNSVDVIQHPAAYDPSSNSVFCGTNLRQLGADLAATRLHHVQQLAAVTRYEASIQDLYRNSPRAERERHLKTATDERSKVLIADRRNDAVYDEATARLYGKLYHEAFHAYIFNNVYPESLPRWLNEGLAQIFETAILDGFELRLGHADTTRLNDVQAALKTKSLMSVGELLLSTETQFALSPSQPERSKASYLAAWAVAHHLAFGRRAIGTEAFEVYLQSLKTGTSPRVAFEKLIGKDLAAYEAELQDYLRRLQPDGTLKK